MLYYVMVTDSAGCKKTDSIYINVEIICGEVFVPNVFSPNADSQNDLECVLNNCIESMKFFIYDRWGEKVFESSSIDNCWNGTFRGKALDPAVFVYYLKVKLITGEEVEKKGNITLLR